MGDRDYAPLSAACVRALTDKLYDKTKAAAVEIEKMVRDFKAANNSSQVKRLVRVLGQELCTAQNPYTKRGGLVGLGAVAVALGPECSGHLPDLVQPILGCFSDADVRVRYFACEALYNVAKATRGAILAHFTDIFSALAKSATDPEQSMKTASELLDRLIKDIVTESAAFDLCAFVPLLRERILTKNTFARQFIISWVSVLDAVPDIDLVIFLPEILDGMFKILEDPMMEIKKMCGAQLSLFLQSIKKDPSRADFTAMINILTLHAQATDEVVQLTALTWIKEFVQLAGVDMLPFMSGIFTAVLPCLAYNGDARKMSDIKETALAVNYSLMKLVTLGEADAPDGLQLPAVVDVLNQLLHHNSVQTKVAVLRWILHLYNKIPTKMFAHTHQMFDALLGSLSDPSDDVVRQSLAVLAEICSASCTCNSQGISDVRGSPYYQKFLVSLLQLFATDATLLDDRGSFIIRQLCVLMNAEDIYTTLGEVLLKEKNLKFAATMVESLNMILLTSAELFELRNQLKDFNTQSSRCLFECLYKCWSHNPVALFALCLLTQNYAHCNQLIRLFGTLEVTVEFLTEIDKLVQLIESPIFAYLRLELLGGAGCGSLRAALYGLLMLLPQTQAFHALRQRLQCLPAAGDNQSADSAKTEADIIRSQLEFASLLEHFQEVQSQHRLYKLSVRTDSLSIYS